MKASTVRRVGSRLASLFASLLIALSLAFLLGRLSGDPTATILGPMAPPEQREALRHELGLDLPLVVQYLDYLRGILTGDLGQSLQFYQSNTSMIADRLPYTLQLVAAGMGLALLVGVPLGVLAATREGTWWDRAASTVALLGQSVPVFWFGMMLVVLFAVKLGWLPAGQSGTPKHLILPALTMSVYPMAHIARLTRASMSEALAEPYIDSARARGLGNRRVVWRHAFANAMMPILTIVVLQTGILLSGAVAVEYVYSWPGLGQLALQAIQFRDFPLVQAIVVFGALVFVLLNLVVDVLHSIVDPRVR
ncbi:MULTISPECIES: ABC transporter permease [Micromonospora]|jgi:peptide/nickel transport system permease protein|uniref:ABC transporter permease n=1 Tax=Micromonospora carbonacea TaxID=47853 RepID=A0A1C5AV76_9ACTN|nr:MULTISPECIES: ABC transporter permease [Micromonospora]MBB5827281.1 peptide/nickel transport system permease protein [Micromonospora carbonacea]MDG4818783.1 ABC transporter permease [Micromonospora sp. WMMD956]QLD24936.1 ABC transporter permease [Micromonospora carbonacea]WFE61339.1 ABC transporter permease [Micromonospora sp. WMMD712]SCF48934.1 peptide/nickel transport system permease protein [Micromonospora carbonacea]